MSRNRRTTKRKKEDSWNERESKDMKRDSRRRRNRSASEGKDAEYSKSTNNKEWYAADPALLRDAASIPFSWPLGQSFDYGYDPSLIPWASGAETKEVIPGICALRVAPSFGANLQSDALNIAAAATYSFVRHTNSGHANYDPNDLMLYIIGMTNVYSYINYLERVYAVATLYEQRNRYLPEAVFYAMHIDADSIRENLADFRYRINILINKVSSIAVPATMTIFLRQAMLYAYIYGESESIKDQLYMYYPDGFYKFTLDSDQAGMLEYVPLDYTNPLTWDNLIDYGENMFNAIWEQEDFGIMSGDILKSYGSAILSLTSLDERVPFSPVYDPMVLHQIKNAGVIPEYLFNKSSLDVTQNANKSRLVNDAASVGVTNIEHRLACDFPASTNKILTLDAIDPDPGMVIEATRLMVGLSDVAESSGTYTYHFACASEIVLGVDYISRTPSTQAWNCTTLYATLLINPTLPVAGAVANRMHLIKTFKYAPCYTIIESDGGATKINDVERMFSIDNYAILSNEDVQKMHTAAMLNLLNVPSAAKNVTV